VALKEASGAQKDADAKVDSDGYLVTKIRRQQGFSQQHGTAATRKRASSPLRFSTRSSPQSRQVISSKYLTQR
jgi:hypothetical protein